MLSTTKPVIKNFFIVSASLSEIVDQKISELSFLARQARYARDYNRLVVIGNELMHLSPRSEDVGRYFHSLAEHRLGRTEFNASVHEELANHRSLPLRAAAKLALGVQSMESGKLDDAWRLLQESYSISLRNRSPQVTTIHAVTSLSQLLSIKGSHKESLDLLRVIFPTAREWGRFFPLILGEQYNNMAFELFKLGEVDAAQYASNKACAMPVADRYPEWFATRAEIETQRQPAPTPTVMFVPNPDVEPEADDSATYSNIARPVFKRQTQEAGEGNVLPFKRKKIEIWLKYKVYTHFLQTFTFSEGLEAEKFLMQLLEGIDDLRSGDSSSTLTIHTRLMENRELLYETENFISKSNIDCLFEHFNTLKLLLQTMPGADFEDGALIIEDGVLAFKKPLQPAAPAPEAEQPGYSPTV